MTDRERELTALGGAGRGGAGVGAARRGGGDGAAGEGAERAETEGGVKASRATIAHYAAGNDGRGVNLKAFGETAVRHALVIVPLPPSTNALFLAVGRRRVVSPAYRAWRAVAYPILSLLAPPESLPCEVWLTIRGVVNRRRDAANVEKAVVDGIVACGVLPDDNLKYVVGNHQLYRPDDGAGRVEVRFG